MALRTKNDAKEFDVVLRECPDDSTLILDQHFRFEFDILDEMQESPAPILGCGLDGNLWEITENPRHASSLDLKDMQYPPSLSSGYASMLSVSSDDSESLASPINDLSLQDININGVDGHIQIPAAAAAPNTVVIRIVEKDALVVEGATPLNSNQAMRDYLESTITCL